MRDAIMTETHYERLTANLTTRSKARKLVNSLDTSYEGERVPVWMALPISLGNAVDPQGNKLPRIFRNGTEIASVHLEIQKYILDRQQDPYSFAEMLTSRDYFELGRYLSEICGLRATSATLQVNYQWLCHERAGKRVYEVSPGLAEQLRYTEVRGIRAEDLRLPYESVYIQIPPEAGLKVWNQDTQWHRVVGAYLTEERSMSEADAYELDRPPGDIRGWRMLMIGEDLAKPGQQQGDDALAYYRILLKDGTNLTDIVDKAQYEMQQETERDNGVWEEVLSQDWENHFRWCMNIILYATWQEPGEHWLANKEARQLWERIQKAKSPKKRKALNQRFQNTPKQRRIRLGHSIIVDRKRTTGEAEKSGAVESGATPNVMRIKTRVAGHWKHVPHGPQRSLRRYQWVEPYWRNKDGIVQVREPKHELR